MNRSMRTSFFCQGVTWETSCVNYLHYIYFYLILFAEGQMFCGQLAGSTKLVTTQWWEYRRHQQPLRGFLAYIHTNMIIWEGRLGIWLLKRPSVATLRKNELLMGPFIAKGVLVELINACKEVFCLSLMLLLYMLLFINTSLSKHSSACYKLCLNGLYVTICSNLHV